MSEHLEATFTIDDWEDEPIDEATEGPAIMTARLAKTYAGDVVGSSVTVMVAAQGDGGAAYLAQERIVGTLAGREGTFVLQHGASGVTTETSTQWATVVPGSGTGALVGLAGTGTVDHGVLTLDYTIG